MGTAQDYIIGGGGAFQAREADAVTFAGVFVIRFVEGDEWMMQLCIS